jgi:hypothetical protein
LDFLRCSKFVLGAVDAVPDYFFSAFLCQFLKDLDNGGKQIMRSPFLLSKTINESFLMSAVLLVEAGLPTFAVNPFVLVS